MTWEHTDVLITHVAKGKYYITPVYELFFHATDTWRHIDSNNSNNNKSDNRVFKKCTLDLKKILDSNNYQKINTHAPESIVALLALANKAVSSKLRKHLNEYSCCYRVSFFSFFLILEN